MTRRGWTVLVGAVVVLMLSLGLSFVPVPYVALGPGPTVNTLGTSDGRQVITVRGVRTSTSEGRLNLTTVSVSDELDLATAVKLWFAGSVAVVPREVVYPPDQTEKQVEQQNKQDFEKSQTSAETAALRVLGYPVLTTVKELPAGSPSAGRLAVGDVITSINGERVTSSSRLRAVLTQHQPGTQITVAYTRGERPGTARVTLGRAEDDRDRAVLGVLVEDRQPHPFTVDIELDRIGGPSAGLMFALGIIDKVEPADLTGGRFIAGTGEIDDDGRVGAIGGIPQKMIAARRAGATVFLVPDKNCAEAAGAAPDGLRLVKVATLDAALDALELLRGNRNPPGCTR